MEERRKITPAITEASRRGWNRFCLERNVNRSALIEALGLELADGRPAISDAAVERAREVQQQRSRLSGD